MKKRFKALTLLAAILAAAPAAADEIRLRNGSLIIGEVKSLAGGKLTVTTPFAKEIIIPWSEVESLRTEKPLPFVLGEENRIFGQAVGGEGGILAIQTDAFVNPVEVRLGEIQAINPPIKPSLSFKGSVSLGMNVSDGNTRTRSAAATAEFEARSEIQRITLRGGYNYSENDGGVTARNSRANIKYDYFVSKRFYLFLGILLEHDSFQDLKLRTALSGGPGFQIIDSGDFQEPWLEKLQLSVEAGLSYFNEDFDDAEDQSYIAARWALKLDWPILPDKITLFHVHEGYPSLERGDDLYIATEQGVRFTIIQNFFASFQVNWRWDSTPASGRLRSDTVYLFTLGYNFAFAK